MSIGVFAERVGLTASALRFYDDAGLLRPERVDPSTGYRFYGPSQLAQASRLRRLREIGMPLSVVADFFAADADEAARLIDEQVAEVTAEADRVRRVAADLRASLRSGSCPIVATLPGPALAAAIDQISASTSHDPAVPVLGGVHVEADSGAVTLTATDRYRLATRTLVPLHSVAPSWTGTLAGDELRSLTSRLRRSSVVTIEANERWSAFRTVDGDVHHCRLLTDRFPDHRLLVRSLPPVTHRITIGKRQVVRVLEQQAPEIVGLQTSGGRPRLILVDGDEICLDGTASGPGLTTWFDLTTVYPAWSHAIGDDLMLDLRGPDLPVTVRSADEGDLTMLVMPRHAPAA